jgi:secreted trypsin-like serine protease
MRFLNAMIITLVVGAAAPAIAQENQTVRPIDKVLKGGRAPLSTTDKIVGGEMANAGEFPFQVALIASGTPEGAEQTGQFCGASLIGGGWVLTAAHCVRDTKPEEIDIYAGSTVLPTGAGPGGGTLGVRRGVAKVIWHQDYSRATMDNDIALLKLLEPAPATLVPARPATSESEMTLARIGADASVIGWGFEKEDTFTTPNLMKVKVAIQDSALCQSNYDDLFAGLPGSGGVKITKNMFCAGRPQGGADSCQGDSGGFIGVQAKDKGWVQLGVVSYGIGCGRPQLFGVYTRVANYAGWIAEVQQSF